MFSPTTDFQASDFPIKTELSYLNPSKGHHRGEGFAFLNSGLYKDWAKRPSDDIITEHPQKYLTKQLMRLGEIFEQKLKVHKNDFDGIDLNFVRKAAIFSALFCLRTNPEKFTVDFTEDSSVVLTLRYPNQKDAYLEMYFEPGVQQPVQLVVLVSENKQNVFAYNGSFLESLAAFMNYMSPVETQVPY